MMAAKSILLEGGFVKSSRVLFQRDASYFLPTSTGPTEPTILGVVCSKDGVCIRLALVCKVQHGSRVYLCLVRLALMCMRPRI